MLEITGASVIYQADTKLFDLAYEIASALNYKKPSIQVKVNKGFKIYRSLQALDYGTYLTRENREKIWYCLIQQAEINDFPVAPVLGVPSPPTFLVGGGNTVINNITYAGGTPFINTDSDIGVETVDTFSITLSKGAVWQYTIYKGNIQRSGMFIGTWASDDTLEYTEESTPDIGGTTDVILSMDISAGSVRLRATASSDNWIIQGTRYLIY